MSWLLDVTMAISAGTDNLVGRRHSCNSKVWLCDKSSSLEDLTGEVTWYWYDSDRSLDILIDGRLDIKMCAVLLRIGRNWHGGQIAINWSASFSWLISWHQILTDIYLFTVFLDQQFITWCSFAVHGWTSLFKYRGRKRKKERSGI